MLRLVDLFSSNHITFLDPNLIAGCGKYSQSGKYDAGSNGAVHTQAREGPGTSSYTIVPSHALKACQHLRSSSLCRRPPAAALALLGNGVHTHIVIGQMAVCLTRVCPTQTRPRQPAADRAANETMVINVSSGALCKAHTLCNHSGERGSKMDMPSLFVQRPRIQIRR